MWVDLIEEVKLPWWTKVIKSKLFFPPKQGQKVSQTNVLKGKSQTIYEYFHRLVYFPHTCVVATKWQFNKITTKASLLSKCLFKSGRAPAWHHARFYVSIQLYFTKMTCILGVVNSKKFPRWGHFSTDFGPKVTDLPSIFGLTSIWSCTAASKSGGLKSTLLNKSCSNQKILADLLLQLIKLF